MLRLRPTRQRSTMKPTPDLTADLHQVRRSIADGHIHPTEPLERALQACEQPSCRHAYVLGPQAQLRQAIEYSSGQSPTEPLPLAGLPVSVKDLFDVAGQPTRAGSVVLQGPAATQDCPAVARVRAAGGLIAGRTNMTEFAFSGVGINPHHGTPVNPADSGTPRIPGGSSSGAAVSVALGAAWLGLGSDTGGSLRIPAALCGLVGFKSTARLVPTEGAIPLSTTLDTVGAITRSVRDAVLAHEVLAQRRVQGSGRALAGARLALARTWMLDDLQAPVATAFERSLRTLSAAGAHIEDIDLTPIADLAQINAGGGFSAAESYAWHRPLLEQSADQYDPRVAKRILRGAQMSAADYVDLLSARKLWIARMEQQLQGYDAVISPTVPILAPPIAPLEHDDEAFFRVNALLLRNTSVVNMLDGCAISLPCHAPDELPVGLMLWHGALHDDRVLELAGQIEAALAGR
jgi:aspartyl-tRNA(Asn)/glutamyl-tRNA(Gln) amidotransferase subunit A